MWIFALYFPQKTTKTAFLSENTREPSTILYTGNFERVALFIKNPLNKTKNEPCYTELIDKFSVFNEFIKIDNNFPF